MKFERGDKIFCINTNGYDYLTLGKEYTVLNSYKYYVGYKYIIVDDYNNNRSIIIENFVSSRIFKIQKIKDEIQKRRHSNLHQ